MPKITVKCHVSTPKTLNTPKNWTHADLVGTVGWVYQVETTADDYRVSTGNL